MPIVGGVGYPPEAAHVRLPGHRDGGGEAGRHRPRSTGCTCAPWLAAGSPGRGRRCVRAGGVHRLAVRRGGAGRGRRCGARLPSWRIPPSPGAGSGTPRPTRPTRGICGNCWPRAGCPSAGSRRRTSWSAGRCWRPIDDLRAEHTAWVQLHSRGVLPSGRAALGDGALRTDRDLQALRAGLPPRTCHRPGSCRRPTALDMLAALEARLDVLRHRGCWLRARSLTGARVLTERLYGVGPDDRAGHDLLAGRRRAGSSSARPVRFAGLDVTVWSSDRKGLPAAVRQGPPAPRWRGMRPARPDARASASTTATTPPSRTARTASAPPSPRPAQILRQACHILTELGDDALTAA